MLSSSRTPLQAIGVESGCDAPAVLIKETRSQSGVSLPWKREEIDGERLIAEETKEINSKDN